MKYYLQSGGSLGGLLLLVKHLKRVDVAADGAVVALRRFLAEAKGGVVPLLALELLDPLLHLLVHNSHLLFYHYHI